MKNYNQFLESIKWYINGDFVDDGNTNLSNGNEYDDFITDDEFRQFLIDEKCYDKYIKNVKEFKYDTTNLKNWFNKFKVDEYISSAFAWDDTKEGFNYWWDVDICWLKYVEK